MHKESREIAQGICATSLSEATGQNLCLALRCIFDVGNWFCFNQ
jgi:hypothetical protein